MKVLAICSSLSLAACSTIGARTTEQPTFRIVAEVGGAEIRQYGARVAAETIVDGDEEAARTTGFRRLADYIATAKVAMTAPVSQAPEGAGGWRIRFFMPARDSLETLPKPADPAVTLVPVPPETVAVLRFSGSPGASAVADRTAELVRGLEASAWRPAGEPVAWFYDPPWALALLRRNEVAIPVSPK
jgi:hypothetical protein